MGAPTNIPQLVPLANTSSQAYLGLRQLLFFVVVFLLFLCITKQDIQWKWAHIFFSYEYGFMKRGLIGEFFRLSHIPSYLDNYKVVAVLMLLGVAIAFYQLIKSEPHLIFVSFSAYFFCSALLFKNLVCDWGRFDQIAIIVFMLQLLWLDQKSKLNYLYFLSPLLLLVHEATILWVFPALVSFVYFEDKKKLFYLLPALALGVTSIFLWGGLDIDPQTYLQRLQAWAKPDTVYWAIIYTLTASIYDSVVFSLPAIYTNIESARGHQAIALLVLHSAPLVFYKSTLLVFFNVLALVCASLLFVLAIDHFRWISLMAMINLFFLIYAYKRQHIKNNRVLFGYLISISLLEIGMDPVGIYQF